MKSFCTRLNPGNIRIEGWLRNVLECYSDGLLGHLEEIWPDVGPDNAWKGGNGDSWERGPYYVDGLVPMSFLLESDILKAKADVWISNALSSQRPDGDFGPVQNDDWWPRMVMLKAITQYADGINDEAFYGRTEAFIDRYLEYFRKNIEQKPFSMWAYVRGGELISTILWMYDRKHDERYLEIARIVLDESMDWYSFFSSMPFELPAGAYLPWNAFQSYLERFNAQYADPMKHRRYDDPFFRIFHQTHGVNIAMGLKYLAYQYAVIGNESYRKTLHSGYCALLDHHGQITGVFSCDEHLNGTSPEKGTELCTVVELMYSLEEIMRIIEDYSWMDLLERLAFNALPATIAKDGCSHQYDQMVNQISCTIAHRGWYNNLDDSNIFGLEPNFGCCTANMHQGMPKYASFIWLKGDEGYRCLSYIKGKYILDRESGLSVAIDSCYPFSGDAEIHVHADKPFRAKLMFRIPSWASNPICSAGAIPEDGFFSIDREWKDETLSISFGIPNHVLRSPHGISLERGPIILALPIKKDVKVVKDRGRFSDYEYRPVSEWRYCISAEALENARITVCDDSVSAEADAYRELSWTDDGTSCSEVPSSPVKGSKETIHLIPYGMTNLRIAVFPEIGD